MLRPTSLLFALLILGLSACEYSHDEVYEDPINSALFVLTPDSGTTVVLQYMDRDGEGGRPAIVSAGTLQSNTTYQCELLLNTVGKHLVDSSSVAERPELHQVFFLPQNGLELNTTYADRDANGFPVGLKSNLTSSSASSGRLTVIIVHNPNKSGLGVSTGEIANAGGLTDLEVNFNVIIR